MMIIIEEFKTNLIEDGKIANTVVSGGSVNYQKNHLQALLTPHI